MAMKSKAATSVTAHPYTIAQTKDVLVIEIPLRWSRYPGRNDEIHGGAKFARKSEWYNRLFETVKRAAEEAVAAGWIPLETHCDFSVRRICSDWRVRDAMNLGGCEANALTKGGAWTDDTLGAPAHVDVQVEEGGQDRIELILRRQYPRDPKPRAARPIVAKRQRGRSRARAEAGGIVASLTADGRVAEIDGRPASPEEARKALDSYLRGR
jgi:hypothetical protein